MKLFLESDVINPFCIDVVITGRFIKTATKTGKMLELSQNNAIKIMATTGVMRIICRGILKKFLKNVEYAVRIPEMIPIIIEMINDIITLPNVAAKLFQNSGFFMTDGSFLKICSGDGSTKTEFIFIARSCHKINKKRTEHKYAVIFVAVILMPIFLHCFFLQILKSVSSVEFGSFKKSV